MQDRMEDKQKELEEKLKDHVGNANPEPQPETHDGQGITINGNIIIGDGHTITITLMQPCPPNI